MLLPLSLLDEFQRFGLLRGLLVFGAGVHPQLLGHLTAQGALGQHAHDGVTNREFGLLSNQLAVLGFLQAACISGMMIIDLLVQLFAGKNDLVGVNDDHEIMMITSMGIIIQIPMIDVSIIGRHTSGVKLINLEKGVKVAKIAKVREKISDGNVEYDEIDDALEEIPEAEEIEDENLIFPVEEEEE